MSYRSIKRVLGENSLERKCRILFGICMLLLIGGSFWGVMRLTEDFVREDTRKKAKQMLEMHLLKTHLASVSIPEDDVQQRMLTALAPKFAKRFNTRMDSIVLDKSIVRRSAEAHLPVDAEEKKLVKRLVEAYEPVQIKEHYRIPRDNEPASDQDDDSQAFQFEAADGTIITSEFLKDSNIPELYVDRYAPDNQYQFYQPIIFTDRCAICHFPATQDPQTGEWTNLKEVDTPKHGKAPPLPATYVLRLTQSYKDANEGISRSRAILLAAAIVTAFLSTAALYAIIRYVIVKPLKHLQDVIQQVSKGKMEVRSNLNTGDEFEELSKSLNRMLRHLADSQSALEDANADLDRKVDEQAQLTMKLFETNQIKSDFLANMSHELRTPLNSIIGFSEVLAGLPTLNDKQQGYASNIRSSGHMLLELINNILDLAKLEAGKTEARPQDFSIEALVTELGEMVTPLAEKKHIEVQIDIQPNLPMLFQDQGKVRQILTNLLSNAIKFTPEGGRIKATVWRHDNDLVLEVRDTGVGIAEDDRKIIFEKFRQAPSTIGVDSLTRRHSGTGLGLSIVKELCILLGGSIEVESEVGKGSVFTVTLPWTHDQLPVASTELAEQIEKLQTAHRIDMTRANISPSRNDVGNASESAAGSIGHDSVANPESIDPVS